MMAVTSYAQTINAPGSIDLNQKLVDYAGKPIPNDTTRVPGLRALTPIEIGTLKYAKDAKVTDTAKVKELVVALRATKAPSGSGDMTFAVEPLDPSCEKCAPLLLRWVLAQALVMMPCQSRSEPGTEENPFCTDAEKKAEADPFAMEGRRRLAYSMSPPEDDKTTAPLPSVVLGKRSIDELDNLIAARFDGNPTVVVQAQGMIDKNVHEKPWGGE